MELYQQRALLEKDIFFLSNGKVEHGKYWSLPLGTFECTLVRSFPGEGNVEIDANVNFSLLSSMYIEGSGYGSRGKISAEGHFAVQEGDSLKTLELNEIDYVYQNGRMVKLKDGTVKNLYIKCENNKLVIKRMQIMLWVYDNKFKELKHSKDVSMVQGFSFTKNGAYSALKAQ